MNALERILMWWFVLTRIRELKAAGYTTRQIADELNRQEFTPRRGTGWRFQYVADALRAA